MGLYVYAATTRTFNHPEFGMVAIGKFAEKPVYSLMGGLKISADTKRKGYNSMRAILKRRECTPEYMTLGEPTPGEKVAIVSMYNGLAFDDQTVVATWPLDTMA